MKHGQKKRSPKCTNRIKILFSYSIHGNNKSEMYVPIQGTLIV